MRERVALIDMSSFSKFEIVGEGALAALQRIAANDLGKPPGALTYTQLCNARGGIEADLTIARLDEDRFYVVTGSGFGVRDGGWIAKHLPRDGSVSMRDVTSAKAVINLCGPRSRAVLGEVADGDVSDGALPYMAVRPVRIGYAPVDALRVTYVGELGYELHLPVEYAQHVYELLWEAGRAFGIADAGYRAVNSLRLEKGYLYWGADITPDYTPYDAGLGFAVALKKGDFIGREALAMAKSEAPRRRLCCFLLDEPAALYGGEAIWLWVDASRRHDKRRLRPHDREKHRLRLRPGRARQARDLRDRDLRPPRAGGAVREGAVRPGAAQDSRVN